MKIGIVSDTHGSMKRWRDGWVVLQGTDIIIHCGDIFNHGSGNPLPEGYAPKELAVELNDLPVPFHVVRGNCDSDVDQLVLRYPLSSPYLFCRFDDISIAATHGHLYDDERWAVLAARWKVSLLLSGHTHRSRIEKKDDVIFVNPGSPSLPRDFPSVAVLDTRLRTVTIFDIINYSVFLSVPF